MSRVRAAASELGAGTFEGEGMAANKAWIQAARESGAKVYDEGPDFERRLNRFLNGERPDSPFYAMERQELKGYTTIELWQRTGKFWGTSDY